MQASARSVKALLPHLHVAVHRHCAELYTTSHVQVSSWQQLAPRLSLQPLSAVHLLSSVSSIVGNPGQANYAAANAALSALAGQQAAKGLPGTAGAASPHFALCEAASSLFPDCWQWPALSQPNQLSFAEQC